MLLLQSVYFQVSHSIFSVTKVIGCQNERYRSEGQTKFRLELKFEHGLSFCHEFKDKILILGTRLSVLAILCDTHKDVK